MEPLAHRIRVNGIELAYFEWLPRAAHGSARGAERTPERVLLVHATGFHARVWDRTVAALPPHTHVLALDARGHGRSEKRGPYTWSAFGADLAEFLVALDLEDVVGVGHSMGGHAMVQAAAREPRRFRRLLLVDPVIMAPEIYSGPPSRFHVARPEDHPTAKRRGHWRSWQEMFERFEHRHPFNLWRREVLEDYCRYGVLENPRGEGVVLACPPLVEAEVYTGNSSVDVRPLIARIRVPVTVLRARGHGQERGEVMDFARSPTWPGLAGEFVNGRDVHLPELTHFIPMQAPELVADYIADRAGTPVSDHAVEGGAGTRAATDS